MKKEIYFLILISLFFLNGCTLFQELKQFNQKNDLQSEMDSNPELQARLNYIIEGERSTLDICYDHNTHNCEKFFDYAVNTGLMTQEERKTSIEEDPNRPGRSWNFDFSLDALNTRRDVLNRYFENVKKGCIENDEIISSIDCSGRCKAIKHVDKKQYNFFY